MIEYTELLHYATVALAVSINSMGVGIGEGLTGKAALTALHLQPKARVDIMKTAILGMALIETAAIMGASISIILLLGTKQGVTNIYTGIAELGIALAICLSGFVIGLVSSYPAQEACMAVARQPFFSQKIFRFMLIRQSVLQTPIIFGFIIAMFIKAQAPAATTLADSLRLLSSGLCIGLGSIGPAIGLALLGKSATHGLGINRHAYDRLFSFTFISEAIIETPIIFALIISIALITSSITDGSLIKGIMMFSAGLCMSLSTIGPGISSGRTAAAAAYQIARDPEKHAQLSRISMVGQGLIDTCAIYGLLVAGMLILF